MARGIVGFLVVVCIVGNTADTECDRTRLKHLPEDTHDSWCKVLTQCEVVGSALLGTAVNCTTTNTIHTDKIALRYKNMSWAQLGILKNVSHIISMFKNGHSSFHFNVPVGRSLKKSPLTSPQKADAYAETHKMCNEPICMKAVQNLYDVAISTQEWKAASRHGWGFHPMGRQLAAAATGLPGAPGALAGLKPDAIKGLQQFFGAQADPELQAAVSGLKNAAEAQLRLCMRKAEVTEAELGLPVSIARMTGDGKFLDATALREKSCYTMSQWLASRLSYYSGMDYATERAHDGTNVGLIIGIVIGSINLACCLGGFVGLILCLRKRMCYFCMKDACPCCVDCIVALGCGPPDAERLNNEVVMNSGDAVKVQEDIEMQPPHSNGAI